MSVWANVNTMYSNDFSNRAICNIEEDTLALNLFGMMPKRDRSMGVTEHFPLLFHNNKQTHHCYSQIKSKYGTIGVFLA